MEERWRIELFGGLRARRGDREISSFRKQRAGSLLAYLAYYPSSAHLREAVVEALWPGADIEIGRNNLRSVLHALREELEPGLPLAEGLLRGDRSTVGLRPGAFATDVAGWQAALAEAACAPDLQHRIEYLSRAVGLYRGELLPGHYEGWVLTERERRAEEHLRALHELAQALGQSGDLEQAIAVGRQAVAADPLREESHCALMRLYAAAGQPSACLRQYQELERVLLKDLGEAPAAATRALAEALCEQAREKAALGSGLWAQYGVRRLAAAFESGSKLPHSKAEPRAQSRLLPAQFTRFFGREDEIVRAMESLCLPETRLLTLTGPGGAGKTRLAVAVAERLSGIGADLAPFDSVAFVSLVDLEADRVADGIVAALSAPPASATDPLERAVAALAGQRWLLILDNFERLVAEGALVVRRLLERLPELTCLVTSRQRLNLSIEREFPVPPLPVSASVPLFTDRAQAARPGFQLTPANRASVAELCERLEGMPLALELAAARTAMLSPGQILAMLSRRFELLVTRQQDVPARHRTMLAAIDGSFELLSPDLQRFFAGLSVFRGGWTLAAAEAVAPPLPSQSVMDALEALCHSSLVTVDHTGDEPRYRMLETLREFAAERLAPEAEQALRQRHLDFCLALAQRCAIRGPSGTHAEGSACLETEYPNLSAAMAWSFGPGGDSETGLRLAYRLDILWTKRKNDGRKWLMAGLESAPDAAPELRAAAFYLASQLASSENDSIAAVALMEEALVLRRRLGEPGPIADVLWAMAFGARSRREFAKARACLEEAVAIRRADGSRRELAWLLDNLAWTAERQGDLDAARTGLAECLERAREWGFMDVAAYTLHGQGWIEVLHGDVADARSLWQEALAVARALMRAGGDPEHHSALDRRWRDLPPELAREALEGTLEFNRVLRNAPIVVHTLGALGHLARGRGDLDRCEAYYRESLALRRAAGDEFAVAQSLEDLACLAACREQYERATLLLGAAESMATRLGYSLPVAVPQAYEQAVSGARAALGEERFAAAWAAGRQLSPEEALREPAA
jgi:predicted ATPase/DNA-binding SARP family transcriptional activator